MKCQDQRILRQPIVLIVLHFIFFIGLPGGISTAHARLPADLSAGINILAEYKSNAEQHARILVLLAADDDIAKDDYRKGQSLYAQAKAAFDGWIDQLVFEIESGTLEAISFIREPIQEKAKTKGDEFVGYVLEQIQESTRGPSAKKFKSIFESIKDVAIAIVTGATRVNSTEQTAVIKKLEEYKWPEFYIIEKSVQ